MSRLLGILILASLVLSCKTETAHPPASTQPVLPGVDVFLAEHLDIIRGKNVGLITNPTGVTRDLTSTIDALHQHPEVNLTAIYGPEHGARGDVPAGDYVATFKDLKTGLTVFSLYGRTKKPTPEMLAGIDVLMFDIQDIGVRPYTYIYTMAYAMQAAAENNLPFIVLDRPNPLGGELLQPPVLQPEFASFIGLYPIPYVHGMTIGELAQLFNTEFDINAKLSVIPMKNWQRDMTWKDTGLQWIPTSPHVPEATTPFFLACTGSIGELHVVNEGVGYTAPFQYIGADWIDADKLAERLNLAGLAGIHFRPVYYRPYYGAQAKNQLQGVQLHITNPDSLKPILVELAILTTLESLYPERDFFNLKPARRAMFDKSMGTDQVRLAIENGDSAKDIYNALLPQLEAFKVIRQKYLLYP